MNIDKTNLSLAIKLGCSVGFILSGIGCSIAGNQKSLRPNFLILVSDDQRWDQLSCAEHPLIPQLQTPNLDKLANEGAFFRNAFATSPVCAVSRASIMTGRYASSHGMNRFNTPIAPEVLHKSYPAILHENGYETGILGKWGIGTDGTAAVFDVFNAWATQGVYFMDTDSGKIHETEWLARQTRTFLETRNAEKPFCLTVCFKSPHHPYQPDKRDENLFGDLIIPKRKSDTPLNYQAMNPAIMEKSLNRWCYFDERKDETTKNNFEKNFLRCVVSLDRSVGKILDALRELKLDENTVIIYISDNGYLWGEHGLGGKWLLYEESVRVPIIFRIPDLPSGRKGLRFNELALNIDVAPTILNIAGIPVPSEMNGMSLFPLIRGKKAAKRTDFFMEHVHVVEVEHPIPDSRGVRSAEWKYIRYVNVDPEVEEMYHLTTDPMETKNLVNDVNCLEIKNNLKGRYDYYLNSFQK